MKNCFDRTPHTMKDWLLLAAGVAAVFAAADWLPGVLRGAGAFLGLLAPFGWGLLLAYVLDIPTRFFAQAMHCFSVRWRCWRRSSSRSSCRA